MKSKPVKSFGPKSKALIKEKISDDRWVGRANIQNFSEMPDVKTWTEAVYDHEPTELELSELANVTFE